MPAFLTGSSFVGLVSGYKRRRQQAEIVHPSDETELLQHHTMKHRMTEKVEVFHHNVLKNFKTRKDFKAAASFGLGASRMAVSLSSVGCKPSPSIL